MLDTNVWSGFKDSNSYAEYAIGGPTLELFVASYNATHETDIETQVSSKTGYQVRWSGETFANSIYGVDNLENLYVMSNTNAYGMWIASPSSQANGTMMDVHHGKSINIYNCSVSGCAARPIVCLRSSTKLEKQKDGTFYMIVE